MKNLFLVFILILLTGCATKYRIETLENRITEYEQIQLNIMYINCEYDRLNQCACSIGLIPYSHGNELIRHRIRTTYPECNIAIKEL